MSEIIASQSLTDSLPSTKSATAGAPASTPHCRHRTKQNRHCRLPILDPATGLCFRHAGLRTQQTDAGDLSAELLGQLTDFTHAGEVKDFLSKLVIQIARNRIAVKRAAVLAYICAQILRSFRDMAYEDKLRESQTPTFFINDLPRPVRPAPKPEPPSMPDGLSNYAHLARAQQESEVPAK